MTIGAILEAEFDVTLEILRCAICSCTYPDMMPRDPAHPVYAYLDTICGECNEYGDSPEFTILI